jgi:hypothetical protein
MLKLTKLSTAIAASLLLSSCGLESSSVENSNSNSISGKTADGYLTDAKVCIDLNDNSICDSGEPTTTSTAGGVYEFTALPKSVNPATARIVVEAIVGQTVDEDDPDGKPVTKAYTLSSPPGQTDFVSPITTMVDVQMKNAPDLDKEQAKALVKQKLNISADSEVDLFEDYVENKISTGSDAKKDQALQADNQRLHYIAQAVTQALADNLDQIQQSSSATDVTFEATLSALVEKITDEVTQITDAIDTSIANDPDDVNPQAIATGLKEQLEIAVEDLHDAVDAIANKRQATQGDMKLVLSQNGGLYFMESDTERDFQDSDNTCQISTFLGFGNYHYNLESNTSTWQMSGFNPTTADFEVTTEDHDYSAFVLAENGTWQQMSETNAAPTVEGFVDGKVHLSFAFDGEEYISAKVVDLEGTSFSSVLFGEKEWLKNVAPSAVFPPGAIGYSLNSEQINDYYRIHVWEPRAEGDTESGGCDSEWAVEGNCNVVRTMQQYSEGNEYVPVTNLDSLINSAFNETTPQEMQLFNLVGDYNKSLYVAMIETNVAGTVNGKETYAAYYEQSVDEDSGQQSLRFKSFGGWKKAAANGVDIIKFDIPGWLHGQYQSHDRGTVFIAVQNGAVRVGELSEKGKMENDELAMNNIAITALQNALSSNSKFGNSDSTLDVSADAIECGYWHAYNETPTSSN